MKAADLANRHTKRLDACVHGGDVWEASSRYGLSQTSILDFSSNVNPLGPSPKAIKSLKANLWRIPFYPDSRYSSLRNAVAEYLGAGPENVIVGNGSTELIYLFCEVFVREGAEVLIPEPTFGEYEVAVRRVGAEPKFVKMSPQFIIDTAGLSEMSRNKSKIILICNPNNPTSTLTDRDDLIELLDNAAGQNSLVFIDEDFIEFTSEPSRQSLTDLVQHYSNLFILRSFTKFFGLTGLRVGYGVACRDIIDQLCKAKAPWNVNCLAEVSAVAALKDSDFAKRTSILIEEERDFLFQELSRIKGFKAFTPKANFILVDIKETGLTAAQLKEELLKLGILIRDCSSFRELDDSYIRIAVRTRPENQKLLQFVKKIVGD